MNKKQTLFEKRQAMKALRNGRLEAGLCSECGERERTRNLDGSKSVRCAYCKEQAERHMATHRGKRPPTTDEYDMADDLGYLDTPEFVEYCEMVKRVICRLSFAPSIGDMRRTLGDNFVDRMHADALDHLMASGEIRERRSGAMTRYEPATRHERSTIEWGRQYINGAKGVPKPDDDVFNDRRVTA